MPDIPHAIAGYDFGHPRIPQSPVTLNELHELRRCAAFLAEEERLLRMASDILIDQAEKMVDVWRERIGAQKELARWFFGPDGKPDQKYKAAVKLRFVRWVIDTCTRPFDQAWLDYQNEIGRRHTPEKKNETDEAQTPPVVPLRYLIGFAAVIVTTSKHFLAVKGHSREQVEAMHAAWTKAVLMSIALWSRAYTTDGLW